MFDQVFDCLNVSSINQDCGGKIALAAYRNVSDWRFEVSSIIRNTFNYFVTEFRNTTFFPQKAQVHFAYL